MADVRFGTQTLPEVCGITSKIISKINTWALETKIMRKELILLPPSSPAKAQLKVERKDEVKLPPNMEYIIWLQCGFNNPHPLTVWCEFINGRECFILRCRTYVGQKNEEIVTKLPKVRKHFISEIVKYSELSGLYHCYNLGSDRAFYRDFYDEFYCDEFFQCFWKVGGLADYIFDVFWNLYLKYEPESAIRDSCAHMYL